MSVKPPEPDQAEGYCTPEDVGDYFDKYDQFDESTDPSREQVKRRILSESNWIDNYTAHAWRPRRVEDEYKSLGGSTGPTTYYWRAGTPLKLMKRDIRTPLDAGEGDRIEIWQGNDWTDWVADPTKTEGRNGDYWVEDSTGMLYIYRRQIFFQRHKEIRVSYRYGKERVPQTIRDVCAKRVAAHYLRTQQYRVTTPGNEEAPDALSVAERFIEESERQLEEYVELRTLGNQ